MPTAAIGFDLGETLLTYAGTPLNWAALYPEALKRAAERLGRATPDSDYAESIRVLSQYNTRLHPRRQEIAADKIFGQTFASWHLSKTQLDAAIEAFFTFFQQRMTPYPETADVLRALRSRGIRIGVLTDVPYGMPRSLVERDLRDAGLFSLVDHLFTSVEIGWRKPEPQGFLALAAALGVAPAELWFVGNEEKDIAGALAAGVKAVLVDRENRRPDWGQSHTVRDLHEMLARI